MSATATSDASHQPAGFHCNGCGKCCTNLTEERGILLGPADVLSLARALAMPPSELVARHVRLVRFDEEPGQPVAFTIADEAGRCPFLDADNRCRVHAGRPAQCRLGPFGLDWPRMIVADYDCLEETVVPHGWNTEVTDRAFFAEVLHASETEALAALLAVARSR